MSKTKPTTIAEYINSAPNEAQKNLRELYAILKKAAPGAREGMKWSSPVFEEKRILFAFAAFKSHLNFMPTPSAMMPFKVELAKYTTGKGSIQFPYYKPRRRRSYLKLPGFASKNSGKKMSDGCK